ncbi:MAG: O-antigen ligase family protein [Actinomycetota bacterium]|nr:O-antigen ligase family protein [Actinomycetota bacterium]
MTDNGIEERPREGKNGRPGRRLVAFKAFVLGTLVALTGYGMFNSGLFGEERWIPVAGVILALAFFTLFISNFYADVSRAGWILVGLMAVLVFVKGLSLVWTISPPETIEELLRSSMYLATFAMALAALSSRRLVPPFMDGLFLISFVVAGYGLLQKINPAEYPTRTMDAVRIGSTIEYSNTVAVVLGMAIVLGLARMTQLKGPIVRGFYAVGLTICSLALYFTLSRGGLMAVGLGMLVLFALSRNRLQMFANVLLFSVPLLWVVQQAQGLEKLFETGIPPQARLSDGSTLQTYILIAAVVVFVFQAVYALSKERYELLPAARRALSAAAVALVLVGVGFIGYTVVSQQLQKGGTLGTFTTGIEETEKANERLTSLSSNSRSKYWSVAWEEWKEHPLAGTGAGTFHYTWLENRPGFSGVRQVHNVYLEQGTETGAVAFLALAGFAAFLVFYTARGTWRATGERRLLLSGLTGAVVVYLFHSSLEWHWYIPPSTLFFFVLAAVAVKYAEGVRWEEAGPEVRVRRTEKTREKLS